MRKKSLQKKNRPAPSGANSCISGVISRSGGHFAFLIPDLPGGTDLYLDERHLNGAMHGDRVLARLLPGGRTRGEVVQVLQRAVTQVVGVVENGWLTPDDARLGSAFFIEAGGPPCPEGAKALCRITRYAASRYEQVFCQVERVLGMPDDRNVDVLSVLYGQGVPVDFPAEVRQQCDSLPGDPTEADFAGRRDLRADCIFTIDGKDAKDFDDAVSIEPTPDGWILGVHIADVSHYVTPGSPIDQEAVRRGTSVYPPGMVVPMLPEELSNGLCSLLPGHDRLTFTAQIRFSSDGGVLEETLFPSVIRSKARLVYEEVNTVLDGEADEALLAKHAPVLPALQQMRLLYEQLALRRRERGGIDFDLPEPEFLLDEDNRVTGIEPARRGVANRMIEAFMLAANGAAARLAMDRGLPFLYRVHEAPDPDKLRELAGLLAGYGVFFEPERGVTPKALSDLSQQLAAMPEGKVLTLSLLRSMQKARYDAEPLGHFGLATGEYCHFTSPIRRYPDLFIHRVLKAALSGEADGRLLRDFARQSVALAGPLSDCEVRAVQAERAVADIKTAQYMRDHVGEAFDGRISGLASFGIFITLEANMVEGMMPRDALPGDRYDLDARHGRLIGRYTGKTYRLGDAMRVYVHSVDVRQGRVRLSAVPPGQEPPAPATAPPAPNREERRKEKKRKRQQKRKERTKK